MIWFWLSVVLLAAAQIADIITTNMFMAKGIKESNKLVRWCMDKFGSLWFWPKIALVIICTGWGYFASVYWHPLGAAILLTIPAMWTLCLGVYQNIQQIRKYS
jgi:hypothetical protein